MEILTKLHIESASAEFVPLDSARPAASFGGLMTLTVHSECDEYWPSEIYGIDEPFCFMRRRHVTVEGQAKDMPVFAPGTLNVVLRGGDVMRTCPLVNIHLAPGVKEGDFRPFVLTDNIEDIIRAMCDTGTMPFEESGEGIGRTCRAVLPEWLIRFQEAVWRKEINWTVERRDEMGADEPEIVERHAP